MIIPKELAQAFIEHIDISFLNHSSNSGNKEHYLSCAEVHMKHAFNISWSKGGTWCNCWGDEGIVDEDSEPEPEELNKFLSKYYPNFSEDDVSCIHNSMDEDDDYDIDYYGGRTVQGNKKITFSSLASLLINLAYKENGDYKDGVELIDFNELLEKHSVLVINTSLENYPNFMLHNELNKTVINDNESTKRLKI